jgi:uncharacterized protein YsxB (DUF464 family)
MTQVVFFADESGLFGFEISGHSTESCKDIEGKLVCSAVSSAAYMSANTISEIIGDTVDSNVSDGFMRIIVKNISESSRKVLEGLRLHISELSKQYKSRITTTTEV